MATPEPDQTQAISLVPPPVTSSRVLSSSSIQEEEGRFPAGTLIAGRYRVIALLGRGGMGEVYRATDLTLGQSVALKLLPEDAAHNERVLERFHNEVRVARQVSHANVCRVYDIGEAEGMPFISMEYVDGEDLASLLLRIGRLPTQKALEITRKLCAGLAAAHERGIIHRDLKPHNIMLNKRGEVVIMDFGLAAIAQQIEGAEARNGTPAYMSPEQLRGDAVTASSDIYSLGLIAYELFTGKRAFEGRTSAEQLKLQESSRPIGVSTITPDADPAIEHALERCLQAEPSLRPASALLVAAALPGGDPLAAALAAGQTPSPELVAASGKTHGFPLIYSVPCLAFVLITLFALPFVTRSAGVLAQSPMEFPPAVLEEKGREIAAAFGYNGKPADWYGRFQYAKAFTSIAKYRQGRSWSSLFESAPPIEYFYRQSPQLLFPDPDGFVKKDRPPFATPGMVNVLLDSRGRMREFAAIPSSETKPQQPVSADAVFRFAGLDSAKFREITPTILPQVPFDERKAWRGKLPGLDNFEVTAELATWQGNPTSFQLQWPWKSSSSTSSSEDSPRDTIFAALSSLLMLVGIFCAVYYARKNLRLRRSDTAGALRVGSAAFVFLSVGILAGIHVLPRLNYFGYLWVSLGEALIWATMLWLIYVSLEPPVRARWPHSLITWKRVLAGQIGDARVGSHILLAATTAMLTVCLFTFRAYWLMNHGGTPDGPEPSILDGLGAYINHLSGRMFSALFWGVAVFFLLSGLRTLVRKDWIAVLVSSCLMISVEGTVRQSTNLWLDIPVYIVFYILFGTQLLRVGLLTGILSIFLLNICGDMTAGAEWSSWFNWVTILNGCLCAGLAIFGFWRSQVGEQTVRA